jgi:hypothetical protein
MTEVIAISRRECDIDEALLVRLRRLAERAGRR